MNLTVNSIELTQILGHDRMREQEHKSLVVKQNDCVEEKSCLGADNKFLGSVDFFVLRKGFEF